MKIVPIILFVILFSSLVSASLGISPAKRVIDFESLKEYDLKFEVINDDPQSISDIYLDGDLSSYAVLDKSEVTGQGIVNVHLSLPSALNPPGKHSLIIRARNRPLEDSFIGTRIDVGSLVQVFVPYPGEYIELALNIPDGNIESEIPIEIKAINRGTEELNLSQIYIDFFSNGEFIDKLSFTPLSLIPTQEKFFRKFLDTNNFKSGDYLAEAHLVTSNDWSVNSSFKIGSLDVGVVNFTNTLKSGALRKFVINIKSGWNNDLNDVFADVNFTNSEDDFFIRTPSISLKPWQESMLEGYLDTSDMYGEYDVQITLNYDGANSFYSGKILVNKSYTWIYIISGFIILVVLALLYFIVYKRRK